MAANTPTSPVASPAQTPGLGGGPLSAIAEAAAALFDVVNSALQPGIISASAYFQQLLEAKPSFQNPFAGANESRKNTNTILIYAGVAIILMLLIAIMVKYRKK